MPQRKQTSGTRSRMSPHVTSCIMVLHGWKSTIALPSAPPPEWQKKFKANIMKIACCFGRYSKLSSTLIGNN